MQNKMNIAAVVTDLGGNGAEKSVLNRCKLLKENGHNVVIFIVDNVIAYDTSEFGIEVVPLSKGRNQYKWLGKIGDIIYAQLLGNKMKQHGVFDIVFSHLPRADRVVKLLKHPRKIFTIHMALSAEIGKFSKRRANKKRKLYQYLYSNEELIFISRDMQKDFDQLEITYKKSYLIYNPFDFKTIREKGKESNELDFEYIISSSSFKQQKRYDVLLDAIANLKSDIKLVVLTNETPKLKEMIKQREIEEKVIILGFQQNPYKNAKLLILSSDREGLPRVVVESLILGTAVVSTDCPTGPNELLVDELARWLVPMGDPTTLAKKIDEALGEDKIEISDSILTKFHPKSVYKQLEIILGEKIA